MYRPLDASGGVGDRRGLGTGGRDRGRAGRRRDFRLAAQAAPIARDVPRTSPARRTRATSSTTTITTPTGSRPALIALGLSVAVLLIAIAWLPMRHVTLGNLLEQARPAGTLQPQTAALLPMVWPSEWDSHADAIKIPAAWIAFGTALAGFVLATMFYGLRKLDADASRNAPLHRSTASC